jgi:hypothetical protein
VGAAFFTPRWAAADAEVRGSRSVFRSELRSRNASSPPEGGHYDEVRLKSDTTYGRERGDILETDDQRSVRSLS